jgi:PAS domain-containing protein
LHSKWNIKQQKLAFHHPQALYTALHRSKDGIIITDDTLRTQFANKSVERLLNMKIVSRIDKNETNEKAIGN